MNTILWLLIVAAFVIVQPTDSARILGLFPHTGRSHQMVFEPLLLELSRRGHNVTVVSFYPREHPVPPTYKDISLRGLAPIGIESIDMAVFDNESDGLRRHYENLFSFFDLADMATSICQKIVEWPELPEVFRDVADYDVILLENFNSDCFMGLAHAYGAKAPIVALLTSAMMPWSFSRFGINDNTAYVPCVSTDFTDRMTFPERLLNTISHYYLKYWYRQSIQVKEQHIIERHVGKKMTDFDILAKNISLMLVNTHPSLNVRRPTAPGLIEVGGMHITCHGNAIPAHIEQFLNESEHGVILFSFGSLIKTSTISKYKEDIIIKTLARFPQKVIWKNEQSAENGTLTGNILRLKWLPQCDLLHHPKVIAYIAHGGLLGMTEAVHAGVPMLVIPFFGDQPFNGHAASDAGLATVLRYRDINEERLYNALLKVLNPKMRESAVQLSRVWRDRPMSPLDTAIYWVERTARLGHLAQGGTIARELPFYQTALLDVAATLVLAFLLFIALIYIIFKFLINILLKSPYSKDSKKEKVH